MGGLGIIGLAPRGGGGPRKPPLIIPVYQEMHTTNYKPLITVIYHHLGVSCLTTPDVEMTIGKRMDKYSDKHYVRRTAGTVGLATLPECAEDYRLHAALIFKVKESSR